MSDLNQALTTPDLSYRWDGQERIVDEQEVKPRSWLRVEFAGIAALAMIFGCLFIGETAEQLAENIVPVVEDSKLKPQFNAIDYASTGSTKSATIVIGPCDIKRP